MGARRVRRWLQASSLVILVLIGLAQLVPTERSNPPVQSELQAPAEVAVVLRRACYDCHSNETRWPWYSYVAPFSWWLARHVDRGRGDLNFSEWPSLDFELQRLALRDIEEQLVQGKMPLRSYAFVHRDARLTTADRDRLLAWARSER